MSDITHSSNNSVTSDLEDVEDIEIESTSELGSDEMGSESDNESIYTSITNMDDFNTEWVEEMEEFQEFYPDYPTTLKLKALLVNEDNVPIWMGEERIMLDNNGFLSNAQLIEELNHISKNIKNNIYQKITIDDICLFECNIQEKDMERYMKTKDYHNGFEPSICRQKPIHYLKDDIQLRETVSFFHLLNTLVVIMKIKKKHTRNTRKQSILKRSSSSSKKRHTRKR